MGCKFATELKSCILQVGVITDTSMNLVPLPMVILYGKKERIFSGLDRFFPEEKNLVNSRGKSC